MSGFRFVQYRYILYVNCIMYIEFFVFVLKFINWHTNTFNTRGQEISEKNVWIFGNAKMLEIQVCFQIEIFNKYCEILFPFVQHQENLIITPVDYNQKYRLRILTAKCLLHISSIEWFRVHLVFISFFHFKNICIP